jgi:hypothetical protein
LALLVTNAVVFTMTITGIAHIAMNIAIANRNAIAVPISILVSNRRVLIIGLVNPAKT